MTKHGMQQAIEGFAIETMDGLMFAVKGLVHPPDRVIAYLRYVPDPQGDREREGVRYRRVYHRLEQEEILHSEYPAYVGHDAVFGFQVQGVPRRLVGTVYDPRRCLATLYRQGPRDPVEEDVLGLADLLHAAAGLPSASLGISGSVLVGLHRPDSDIDLTVYGESAARAARRAVADLMEHQADPLRRPNQEELAALHAMHRADTPLRFADFARLQTRKVNEGRFRGRKVFIRFVKWPAEAGEPYGACRFEPLGRATVRGRVTDDRDAIFTPCRYVVADVTFLGGIPVADLSEIISYRGRFSEQARVGEWAIARGSLERVTTRAGSSRHRLVVGGQAGDYLLARGDDNVPQV